MTDIHAKVKGVNLVNETIKEIWGDLVERFRPFLGKQLDTVKGDFRKTVQSSLEGFVWARPQVDIYRYPSTHSLIFDVKSCVYASGICEYTTVSIYLGEIRNGVLQTLNETPYHTFSEQELRSDFTVDEVRQLIQNCKDRRDDLAKAQADLRPFAENLS